MSLIFTVSLQKSLPSLTSDTTPQNWEKMIADFISQKQDETSKLIDRLDQSIQILEHQKMRSMDLIAFLEEAGGLTVRARNLMTTPEDQSKYAPQIKEFENSFKVACHNFDKAALESGMNGINLMNGDHLETVYDTKGQNKLITEGMVLSSETLGVRQPDFTSTYTLQNSRIDVMNAIDIVVTIKNTISAHISDLSTYHEFALHAVDFAQASYDKIGSTDTESEVLGLIKLEKMGQKILGDDALADPAQQEILTSFASSPNMEGL